jgi:hypothetical protein
MIFGWSWVMLGASRSKITHLRNDTMLPRRWCYRLLAHVSIQIREYIARSHSWTRGWAVQELESTTSVVTRDGKGKVHGPVICRKQPKTARGRDSRTLTHILLQKSSWVTDNPQPAEWTSGISFCLWFQFSQATWLVFLFTLFDGLQESTILGYRESTV